MSATTLPTPHLHAILQEPTHLLELLGLVLVLLLVGGLGAAPQLTQLLAHLVSAPPHTERQSCQQAHTPEVAIAVRDRERMSPLRKNRREGAGARQNRITFQTTRARETARRTSPNDRLGFFLITSGRLSLANSMYALSGLFSPFSCEVSTGTQTQKRRASSAHQFQTTRRRLQRHTLAIPQHH